MFEFIADTPPDVIGDWLLENTSRKSPIPHNIPLPMEITEDGKSAAVKRRKLTPIPKLIEKHEDKEVWSTISVCKIWKIKNHVNFYMHGIKVEHIVIDGEPHSTPSSLGVVVHIEMWPRAGDYSNVKGECFRPEYQAYTNKIGDEIFRLFGLGREESQDKVNEIIKKSYPRKSERLILVFGLYAKGWTYDRIAKKVSRSISTVKRDLDDLEKVGVIRRKKRKI
jgi:hypothetical protein